MRQHLRQRVLALQLGVGRQVLPVEQEAHEILPFDGFDFAPQPFDGVAVDARQQMPFAPFLRDDAGRETAAQDVAFAFEPGQRDGGGAFGQRQRRGEGGERLRAEAGQARAHDFDQRAVAGPVRVAIAPVAVGNDEGGRGQRLRIGGLHAIEPFQRHPKIGAVLVAQAGGAAALGQVLQPGRPAVLRERFGARHAGQRDERFLHLVAVARARPGLVGHGGDGSGVQRAQVVAGGGVGPAPAHDGLGAALFQRRVVEEGVGAGVEDFHRQRGRRGQVAREQAYLARFHPAQQGQPAVAVHGVVQAVVQGLVHQRVAGQFALADQVFQAGRLVGEDGGQQVVAFHALQLGRDLAPAREARQRQRGGGVPAPAHLEQRRVEQRLHQYLFGAGRAQVAPHFVERETVAGRERQDDGVLGGGGLQFDIEVAAEALAQRQPPGAVDAAAERRVQHQLHAAALVEEALHHQGILGRQGAQRGARTGQVVDDLARRGVVQAEVFVQPGDGMLQRGIGSGIGIGVAGLGGLAQQMVDLRAQAGHAGRQFVAAPRRFPQPERDVGRGAVRVLDAHLARVDFQDAVGRVPELENVAGHALDGEVFVDGADGLALRFQQHGVVGVVRYGAAGGDGGELAAAPSAQRTGGGVAVQVGAAHAVAGGVAFGQHAQHGVEAGAFQLRVGLRAAHQIEQFILAPFAAGHFGHDLLRQHVQRRGWDAQGVEFAAPHAVQQRGAFDQVVARGGEQAALGQAADLVARAAHALQQRRDIARRAHLAHQVDVADVDAQLQRRGGDQHLQVAALEALFGGQPVFLGQATVVRRHVLRAEALAQVARHALGHAPRVDEDERGPVQHHQFGHAVVDALPHLVRHHRLQRHRRQFQRQVARAHVADIDHGARATVDARARAPDQEAGHGGHGLLGGRQADPHRPARAQRVQPLQAERQMAAALTARHGVDFVHDHAAHAGQHGAAAVRPQQHVQRFGRGDEDVRRAFAHRVALGRGGVAGAHGGADAVAGQTHDLQLAVDALQRTLQIDADVVRQRLQRRHV